MFRLSPVWGDSGPVSALWLPRSGGTNSAPSLGSSHLVSWASFCSRLAWHTLQKDVYVSFYPGVGGPRTLVASSDIPHPGFLCLVGAR